MSCFWHSLYFLNFRANGKYESTPPNRQSGQVRTNICALTLLILLEKYYNRVIFNYQTFKADYQIPPNDFESIGAWKIRKSKFWGATYFFQNSIWFSILTTKRQKLTTKHHQTTTKRFPKKNFINIKKWGASVKLAPQIWIIHNFLNFDHQTLKLDYQTPPNDHQTISYEKSWFYHSCCANFTGIILWSNGSNCLTWSDFCALAEIDVSPSSPNVSWNNETLTMKYWNISNESFNVSMKRYIAYNPRKVVLYNFMTLVICRVVQWRVTRGFLRKLP